MITSLYLPIGYGLFQVLRLLNTSYSLLNVESFILIFIPILFFHSKLVKLYKMINKLNDIQFGKNKYGKVYLIGVIILISLTLLGYFYSNDINNSITVFLLLELWL